jgi:hypothetical protein
LTASQSGTVGLIVMTASPLRDVSSERAHDIAFGQNPDYVLISIGDHCGWGGG